METDISELACLPVSSVMGVIVTQGVNQGYHIKPDTTYFLELPDRRIILLLDSTPRTYHMLNAKCRDFCRRTQSSRTDSKGDPSTERNPLKIVSSWAQEFPSGFVFAVSDGERISISRDALGVRQVYIGEKKGLAGFSTEETLLHKFGFSQTQELEVGKRVFLSQQGITESGRISLPRQETSQDTLYVSAEELLKALHTVLSEELSAFNHIGVSFSGGIDSSIIAKIASMTGTDTRLYTAGVDGSDDLIFAEKAADWLGLPLVKVPVTIEDLEQDLSEIILILKTVNLTEISIALPIYRTFKSIKDDGLSVVLSGQGADEIFGGYLHHLLAFRDHGYSGLSRSIRDDMTKICVRNVTRERKIARSTGLEVLLPYLDREVLRIGLSVSPGLKIFGLTDTLRKAVLRESGRRLNLPRDITYRRKRAVQYSSASLKTIRRLAKKKAGSVSKYLNSLRRN